MSTIILQNKLLKIEISKKGGELQSIKDSIGTEFLWQGDSKYWTGKAPNLFPFIGRFYSDKYTFKGNEYNMPKHGFVRHSILNVETYDTTEGNQTVTFVMTDNKETYEIYPFKFIYKITYTLTENELATVYEVINTDTSPIYFGLGAHPGFNASFANDTLEFNENCVPKQINFSENCFVLNGTSTFKLRDNRYIDLTHDLFDNDAIVLTDVSQSITLKSPALYGDRCIEITYPDMKYLGLWHIPHTDAPYICIEPWTSLPSYEGIVTDFETQNNLVKLEAGKTQKYTIKIKIT